MQPLPLHAPALALVRAEEGVQRLQQSQAQRREPDGAVGETQIAGLHTACRYEWMGSGERDARIRDEVGCLDDWTLRNCYAWPSNLTCHHHRQTDDGKHQPGNLQGVGSNKGWPSRTRRNTQPGKVCKSPLPSAWPHLTGTMQIEPSRAPLEVARDKPACLHVQVTERVAAAQPVSSHKLRSAARITYRMQLRDICGCRTW